ncbi:hypothetical protein ABZ896_38865 [Streptomyces sp. NPDC047072]
MPVRDGCRPCALCAADVSGGPAYLVSGAVRRGWRWVAGRLLICAGC